jgi:hypothetical protein
MATQSLFPSLESPLRNSGDNGKVTASTQEGHSGSAAQHGQCDSLQLFPSPPSSTREVGTRSRKHSQASEGLAGLLRRSSFGSIKNGKDTAFFVEGEDLASLLAAHGLGQYSDALRLQDITLRNAAALSNEDLKELSVTIGHRKLMLDIFHDVSNGEVQGGLSPRAPCRIAPSLTSPITKARGLHAAERAPTAAPETGKTYACFISHYKKSSAMEARFLKDNMQRLLGKECFLDSDDLRDLAGLPGHVRDSDVLVVLQSADVFERPWCLLEMLAAIDEDIPMVAVSVAGSGYDFATVFNFLNHLDTMLDEVNPGACDLLRHHGVQPIDAAYKLSSTIPSIISLPFNASASTNAIQASLLDITMAMGTAKPHVFENSQAEWELGRKSRSGLTAPVNSAAIHEHGAYPLTGPTAHHVVAHPKIAVATPVATHELALLPLVKLPTASLADQGQGGFGLGFGKDKAVEVRFPVVTASRTAEAKTQGQQSVELVLRRMQRLPLVRGFNKWRLCVANAKAEQHQPEKEKARTQGQQSVELVLRRMQRLSLVRGLNKWRLCVANAQAEQRQAEQVRALQAKKTVAAAAQRAQKEDESRRALKVALAAATQTKKAKPRKKKKEERKSRLRSGSLGSNDTENKNKKKVAGEGVLSALCSMPLAGLGLSLSVLS